jgi:hypothetical protein
VPIGGIGNHGKAVSGCLIIETAYIFDDGRNTIMNDIRRESVIKILTANERIAEYAKREGGIFLSQGVLLGEGIGGRNEKLYSDILVAGLEAGIIGAETYTEAALRPLFGSAEVLG